MDNKRIANLKDRISTQIRRDHNDNIMTIIFCNDQHRRQNQLYRLIEIIIEEYITDNNERGR
jgi:hypothetical protein